MKGAKMAGALLEGREIALKIKEDLKNEIDSIKQK